MLLSHPRGAMGWFVITLPDTTNGMDCGIIWYY